MFSNAQNVEVKNTAAGAGESLFAKRPFKKGEIVFVVSGRVVNYATDYTIPIDHDLKVEPRIPGNEAQFLNHSCEPNIGINHRTLLVAMRDIAEGEEVVTNYAFLGYEYGHEKTIDGSEKKVFDMTCRCGAKKCTGVLQCYKYMTPDDRATYKEYVSDYLWDENKYPYVPK